MERGQNNVHADNTGFWIWSGSRYYEGGPGNRRGTGGLVWSRELPFNHVLPYQHLFAFRLAKILVNRKQVLA